MNLAGNYVPADLAPQRLGFGPAAVRNGACALSQCDQLIGWDVLEVFVQPVGPIHIQVGRSKASQTEMQPGIIARVETGLAQYGLSLGFPSVMGEHPGSDGAAI